MTQVTSGSKKGSQSKMTETKIVRIVAGCVCPVCDDGLLVFLEKKIDIHGTVGDILTCNRCFVLVNANAFAYDVTLQTHASETFYRLNDSEISGLEERIGEQKRLLSYILPFLGRPNEKVMLEVGSGRGLMLIAARRLGFRRAIGVDPNIETFHQVTSHIVVDSSVAVVRDLAEVTETVDCTVMWHTLEHIPAPRAFLDNLVSCLKKGAILFLQVPQFYQPYICATHYYFYNEPSIRVLMTNGGFEVLEIGYDLGNQFMTVVARFNGRVCL